MTLDFFLGLFLESLVIIESGKKTQEGKERERKRKKEREDRNKDREVQFLIL